MNQIITEKIIDTLDKLTDKTIGKFKQIDMQLLLLVDQLKKQQEMINMLTDLVILDDEITKSDA